MKFLPLIWANLRRRPLRTIFTFLSIVVAFTLFGVLEALRYGFFGGIEAAGADRLMTMNKMSLIQDLPGSYAAKVRAIPGVTLVNAHTWFGGWYQDERNQLATWSAEPETYFQVYPDLIVPEDERRAWIADRTGVLVGKTTAERFGWTVGQRIPLQQNIPYKNDGNTWEVTVRAIFDQPGADTSGIVMHRAYLDEGRSEGKGRLGWIVSRISDPAEAPRISKAIDEQFANSPAETKTASEKAFVGEFSKQVGDIGAILTSVSFAVFFTMLLVSANTMAQAVRERVSEIGVMKTLGFTHASVTALVLLEAIIITVAGGALGIFLANGMVAGLKPMLSMMVPMFALPAGAIGVAFALMAVFGLLAGALPALRAMNLKVVEALRGA
ncbi:MAG TPA: FtsX-like permease family protein [Steroidobacteraceae bacterium]|nr:FtsX-like permease family protein [Steroidobacteraceae bacterium]